MNDSVLLAGANFPTLIATAGERASARGIVSFIRIALSWSPSVL